MSAHAVAVPRAALATYGWLEHRCTPASSGLINDTFVVTGPSGPVAVLQRQHPVFGADVNVDLDAVTTHLAAKGLVTPRLIRTRDGAPCTEVDGRIWRAITYIEGRTVDRTPSASAARSAGEAVGQFHLAMADFAGPFVHVRAGVHDTVAHLRKLRELRAHSELAAIDPLADEVLAAADPIPDLGPLPERNCHGDLKISNVLFAPDRWSALCLIDLDTCGRLRIAHELGDALRSWGNLAGEDTESPSIDVAVAKAALEGYASGSKGLLDSHEIASIVPGLHTICVELAARFCSDAYEDCYFGWDPKRFSSRREHNIVRARGQLALAKSVATHSQELAACAQKALS